MKQKKSNHGDAVPFVTEWAQLLMFSEAYNEKILLKDIYGEYTPSNRTQFARLLRTFKCEIDYERTLRHQKEKNVFRLQDEYKKIFEIEKKFSGVGQKVKNIAALKREKHKINQRIRSLIKERDSLSRGDITKTGTDVFYRASFDPVFDSWGLYDQDVRLFVKELMKTTREDIRLYNMNNSVFRFFGDNRYKQRHVDAIYYMSCFFNNYFGSALSDIYEIVMKKCAAWHESHTVYDKKGELIKCDPYEHPFILTNEILVDCVRACRFWHYDEKTIEFLTKWNEKALKMQLAVYESNRCVGNGSPYNIYEVSDQAENMGIFKITRLLKHTTKEAMRDPLRECCIG